VQTISKQFKIKLSPSEQLLQPKQPKLKTKVNEVPLEYRDDPDLWYAMQESLGEQRPTIGLNLSEKT